MGEINVIVGYQKDDYLTRRNFINTVPDACYSQVYDIYKLFYLTNRALQRLNFKKSKTIDIGFSFNDFQMNNVDLIHFFNTISFASTPWITTFETVIPRFKSTISCHKGRNCGFSNLKDDLKILRALEAMSGDPCRKLITMSECNLNMQKDFLINFPQYRSEIERKLICLHPPQRLVTDEGSINNLSVEGEIRFMLVGGAFFRKGGMEILESFQEARKEHGHNLKLILVSSLSIDDYASKADREDAEKARRFIGENSDWIEYWERLENQKVLELMKTAHIGLLPTYADSYGFSVLELQAAGCPVISTNIRALPEINNNEIGWVIELPKNRLGEAIYTTEEDRAEISGAIKKGLATAIAEIMDDRQVIYRKAHASLKHVKEKHSPQEFARKLGELYRNACN